MSSRTLCLVVALAALALTSGCGDDKEKAKGVAKPVQPGAVRQALDATDLRFRYHDVSAPKSAGVTEIVAGEVEGRDGVSREFAVWVVGRADPDSRDFDPDWKPKFKGDAGGSSGCGSVLYVVGHAGQNNSRESTAWASVYNKIKTAVCELVYRKGVVLPP